MLVRIASKAARKIIENNHPERELDGRVGRFTFLSMALPRATQRQFETPHGSTHERTSMPFKAIFLATLSLLCLAARGEEAKSQAADAARCQKQVREYLDVLQFIRSTAGSQIGSRVAAGYVEEKSVREVQDREGSCAAAQLIRAKTTTRRN